MVNAHIGKLTFSFFLLFSLMGTLRAVEEGKVACFLLATTALVKMRYSIMKKKMILEVSCLFPSGFYNCSPTETPSLNIANVLFYMKKYVMV